MEKKQIKKTVDEVLALYRRFGNEDYIGEPVSQIEHMCQCAQLAEKEGYGDEVILAAFFHDIGHLCEHIMPLKSMDGYYVDVMVDVKERWYIFPLPIFELADRNFNEWWKTRDFSRTNYGLSVVQNNF